MSSRVRRCPAWEPWVCIASAVITMPVISRASSSGWKPVISLLFAPTARWARISACSWSTAASRWTCRPVGSLAPRALPVHRDGAQVCARHLVGRVAGRCRDPGAERRVEQVRVEAAEQALEGAGGRKPPPPPPPVYADGFRHGAGKRCGLLRDGRERTGTAEYREQAEHDQGRQGEPAAQARAGIGHRA